MKPSRSILFVIVLICAFGVCGRNPFIRHSQAQTAAESESNDLESIIPAQNPTDETDTNAAPAETQPPPAAPAPTPAVVPQARPQPPVQPAQPPPSTPAPKEEMIEIIEFQNAPVFAVLDYYARMTGRSIISAPNLAGTINFRSQSHLTKSEALQALDSVLAINGIGTVPMGDKFLKVVQIATAKQEGLPFRPDGHALPPADTLATQIIPLKYAEANEAVAAIQPYLHPYGQLMALTKSNSILITETGANINQMLEILKYVDQPSALRMETKVYTFQNAKASEVMQQLQSIIQEAQQIGARPGAPTAAQPPGVPPRPIVPRPPQPGVPTAPSAAAAEESVIEGKVILTADERTNKLFVLSRPANFKFFDGIIVELDARVDPDVVIRVIALQYAEAATAAGLMNALITGAAPPVSTRRAAGTTSTTPGYQPPRPAIPPPVPAGGAGQPGTETGGFLEYAAGVRILPDERTNSLLVMATRADMERLVELIHEIDTSVAQVLIEVVIGEVNLDNTLDLSVNTIKRLFQEGQVRSAGVINTTENPLTQALENPNNPVVSNIFPQAMLFPSGLTYLMSFQNLKLDTVVRALATSTKFRVLSTPIIQTLHNQEGSILVGQSRPIITSTVANPVSGTGSGIAVNSNVEYKDIAIELKVTPRINPDGFVTMDIEQKINDVGGNILVNGTPQPIILKREAKSQVTVKNGGTIVLGGLIKENKTASESKVPFFGDIPIVGTLFKGQTNIKGRTELIIFIRPTVLRTPAEELAEAVRRTDYFHSGMKSELEERLGKARQELAAPPADTIQTAPPPDQSSTEPEDIRSAKMKALGEPQSQPTSSDAPAAKTN